MNAASPHWTTTGSMAIARMHHNLVLLPDGTVLAVGGGQQGNFGEPVKTAELYDPATGTWRTMATQAGQRTYHSTALLLPDGRVISAGSNSGKPEQTTVGDLQPAVPVPRRAAHRHVGARRRSPTERLVRRADAGRRGRSPVWRCSRPSAPPRTAGRRISATSTSRSRRATACCTSPTPPNAASRAGTAPYMLFLVNGNGVPSVAPIMSVSSAHRTRLPRHRAPLSSATPAEEDAPGEAAATPGEELRDPGAGPDPAHHRAPRTSRRSRAPRRSASGSSSSPTPCATRRSAGASGRSIGSAPTPRTSCRRWCWPPPAPAWAPCSRSAAPWSTRWAASSRIR